jgi:acyl carrier protein
MSTAALPPERSSTLMSNTITTEHVQKVVCDALESFGADPSQFAPDTTFESLDIDSLDLAELSQVVDDEFGVVLKGEDMKRIRTIGDAVSTIVERA